MHKKIKQMVLRMQEKENSARKRKINVEWVLYILRCNDGSFYTGVTNNLERRVKMHNSGRASRYTRTRRPVELLYQESCGTRTQALVRECSVKTYPRKKKEELIFVDVAENRPSADTPKTSRSLKKKKKVE